MNNISVVIPCRNEAPYIEECIRAIYTAKLPSDVSIKVLVVDGISNDGTREIVKDLINEFPTLKLIDNKEQLTPFAFNLGIHAHACDYVQIVGARHILSNNYIFNAFTRLQKDQSIWCVGGKIINEYINDAGRVIATAMGTKLGMGIGNFRTLNESGFTDTVTSPMYPYWVFEKIGFFDEELIRNQDDDFNYRVTSAGGKIFFDASISLKYYVRGNFKNLSKQFYQYGYWKVFVNRKHKAVTTVRQLVPPLFVAYLMLMLLSWIAGSLVGSVSTMPLLLYILLVAYTAYKLQKEDTSLQFVDLFKTFPILHISYGWGYIRGIVDFLILKMNPSDKNKELSR